MMTKTSENDAWGQDSLPGGGRAGGGSAFVKETAHSRGAAKARVVRDDWDDDDDEEEEDPDRVENEKYGNAGPNLTSGTQNDGVAPSPQAAKQDSSKIWEEARLPMPELIVASASTSQSAAPPPSAALQPTLRILKRPPPNTIAGDIGATALASLSPSSPGSTPGSSSGSGGTFPAPRGTFAEREAQYQEARSRIFGEKEKPGNTSGQANLSLTSRTSAHSGGGVAVIRDPLGATSELELEPISQDKQRGPSRPERGFGERRRGKE